MALQLDLNFKQGRFVTLPYFSRLEAAGEGPSDAGKEASNFLIAPLLCTCDHSSTGSHCSRLAAPVEPSGVLRALIPRQGRVSGGGSPGS